MAAPRLTLQGLRTRPVLVSALAVAGVGTYFGTRSFFAPTAYAESRESETVFGGWGPTTLRLKSSELVSHNTKHLVFEFPDENAKSGLSLTSSLLTFSRPEGRFLPVLRPYSPISSPDQKGTIEFMIKKYPNGAASTHMHSLSPGDTLTFAFQIKEFPWVPNKFSKVHLIAGGLGITPMYQLVQGILSNAEDKTKVNLIFGVNSEEDLLLRKELEGYKKKFPDRFSYSFVVSSLKEEKNALRKGYIDEGLLKELVDEVDEKTKVLICGPDPMVKSLIGQRGGLSWTPGILPRMGFQKDQVHQF